MIAEYDGSGTLQRQYVHGPGSDEPLVKYEGSSSPTKHFLVADERGSIVAMTDSSGATTAKRTYDEYGKPTDVTSSVGRFGYTGQIWLSEIGLYSYKARMYSPNLGKFMTADPIGYGGGMNMYAYVGGDPINAVDPTGLEAEAFGPEMCAIIGMCNGPQAGRGDPNAGQQGNLDCPREACVSPAVAHAQEVAMAMYASVSAAFAAYDGALANTQRSPEFGPETKIAEIRVSFWGQPFIHYNKKVWNTLGTIEKMSVNFHERVHLRQYREAYRGKEYPKGLFASERAAEYVTNTLGGGLMSRLELEAYRLQVRYIDSWLASPESGWPAGSDSREELQNFRNSTQCGANRSALRVGMKNDGWPYDCYIYQ